MTLGELFSGIANAIRSKDGTTGSIPALTFPERIRALSGGGGGPFCQVTVMEGYDGEIIDLPVNLSAVMSVTAEDYSPPKTHALYNGVRLPKMPEDVLSVCPYYVIRYNGTAYQFLAANCPWYYKNGYAYTSIESGTFKYRQYKADTDAWSRVGSSDAGSAPGGWYVSTSGWTLIFSSHDMPNGSATATDIYFEGTDPVPTD